MNKDDVSYRVFTGKQEADRAIHSLKGILLGINLDNEVNANEVNELKQWSTDHKNLINRNPFKEFISSIENLTSKALPTNETIEDLYWLTQKYEGDNYFYDTVTSDIQILHGICHGILADAKITEKEVRELNEWVNKHEHLNTYYPYDEIRSLLLEILADGKVDAAEILLLKAYFKQFVKLHDRNSSLALDRETVSVPISGLCTSEPNVTFPGMTFCITGALKRGTRNEVAKAIIGLGGSTVDSVTLKTNYLIVGDSGNPAWAFSCYGRKVEKALDLRKKGHNISIIHEFSFGDILDDAR
jgi:NAD-dependent DNA ligase